MSDDMTSPTGLERRLCNDRFRVGSQAIGRTLGVRKTPQFFVNGKPLVSFGLPQLKKLVADEVALQYGE